MDKYSPLPPSLLLSYSLYSTLISFESSTCSVMILIQAISILVMSFSVIMSIGTPSSFLLSFSSLRLSGRQSLEIIMILFMLKVLYPRQVLLSSPSSPTVSLSLSQFALLRGNHECRAINKAYGFAAEIRERFLDPVRHYRIPPIDNQLSIAEEIIGDLRGIQRSLHSSSSLLSRC